MSVGIEDELGFRQSRFLKRPDRYIIDTNALPEIKSDWSLEVNHTIGKVEWNPELIQLVPVAAILNTLAVVSDPKVLYEKISIHKVCNLVFQQYLADNELCFEKDRIIPEDWDKQQIVFLGTIASKEELGVRKFYAKRLLNGMVELSDIKSLREARVPVYHEWYKFP